MPVYYTLAEDRETPIRQPDESVWMMQRPPVLRDATGDPGSWAEYGRIGNWYGSHPDGCEVQVSTVFLSWDRRWYGDGPPVLWETMIFDLPEDHKLELLQWRYTSAHAAKRGHHWLVWLLTRSGFVEKAGAEE